MTRCAILTSRHRGSSTMPVIPPRAASSPGTRATNTVVVSIRSQANTNVRTSIGGAGGAEGSVLPSNCPRALAQISPSAPPSTAIRKLSVSTSAARRPRLAPSASRVAVSRWRPAALARKRPATLAHTMNSRRSAAAEKSRAGDASACTGSPLPRRPSIKVRTRVAPVSGRAAFVAASAACCGPIPAGSRAVTASHAWLRSVNGRAVHEGRTSPRVVTGTYKEGNDPRAIPVNAFGATPMIVKTWPFSRAVRPSTAGLPEKWRCQARVAQDRHGARTRTVVLVGVEGPPQNRLHTQHREEIVGHERHPGAFCPIAEIRHHRCTRIERHQPGERVIETPVVQVLRVTERHVDAPVCHPCAQIEKPVGFVNRQRLQERAIDPSEDRRRRAKAECQRQDGRSGEARLPSEHACGVAQILPDVAEHLSGWGTGRDRRRGMRLAQRRHVLSQDVPAPELGERQPPRHIRCRTPGNQFPVPVVEMLRELVDDFGFAGGREAQGRQPRAHLAGPNGPELAVERPPSIPVINRY